MHPYLWLLLPLFALAFLAFVFLFYKVMSFSFRKMGIPRHLVIPALVAILVGGVFNIPIWHSGSTTVSVNVGGAIIPLLISFYLLRKAPLLKTALAVAVVATVSGLLAEVDASKGISLHLGYWISDPAGHGGLGGAGSGRAQCTTSGLHRWYSWRCYRR